MLRKFDLNTANDGASAKASPFHALIVMSNCFRKKRLSILASCMANLSKFHVVFSSSTLIRLNKDAFEGTCAKPLIILYKRNGISALQSNDNVITDSLSNAEILNSI